MQATQSPLSCRVGASGGNRGLCCNQPTRALPGVRLENHALRDVFQLVVYLPWTHA